MTEDGLWPSARWQIDMVDPAKIDMILDRTAAGERLRKICKDCGWPYRTVYEWIKDDTEMQKRFVTALEACGLDWAQEGIEILDDSATAEQPHHVTAANVTPEEVRIEALKKTSGIPLELKDVDALFRENKAKQNEDDGIA